MSYHTIPAGLSIPNDIYVIIEIASHTHPVKYEIDKKSEIIFVDRFILTPMFYPCNYGYINNTLSLDSDPIDVLVPTPYPLQPGCVIRCRPVGMLQMIDESGDDSKIIAVPHDKVSEEYNQINEIDDLPNLLRNQISHFFQNYKNLEINKWSKIKNWACSDVAKQEILVSFQRYKNKN